jgi:hypothetical protein
MTNRDAQSARAWAALTEAFIDEYLADYEMRGEDEDGRDACHKPTDGEQLLIKDAIMGLLQEAWDAASASAQPEQAREAVASDIDSLQLYKTLRDLTDEAGAVDTVIGRPDVLRRRLAALRDAVGQTRGDIPTPPAAPTSETSATASGAGLMNEGPSAEDLANALAQCRDAFPIPKLGSPVECQWASAMACPTEVPEYIRQRAAEQLAARGAIRFVLDNAQLVDCGATSDGWRSKEMEQAVKLLEKFCADHAGAEVPQPIPQSLIHALRSWTGAEPSQSALSREVDAWLSTSCGQSHA